MPQGVHLQLLGQFRLRNDHRPIDVTTTGQRLLALLALRGSTTRTVIAGTLWPEVTEQQAHGSLRTTLWRIHRVCLPLVESRLDALELNSSLEVDVRAFTTVALQVLKLTPALPERLHGGELLPGWDEDWVIFERERLRQLQLHALDAIAHQLLDRRQYAMALEAAMESARIEPLRESAHRAIVAVHLAEHNSIEAIRQYRSFRALLREGLGIEPSALFTKMLHPLTNR